LTSKRIEFCQESIAILRGLGSSARHDLAVSLMKLLWVQGRVNQPSLLREEMQEIFENEKNAFYLSELYWFQTGPVTSQGKLDEAKDLLEKSLALSKEIGDLDGMMSRSGALSDLAWYKGDDRRADELLRDAIRYSRMIKNRWIEPEYHLALGNRALARGEYLEAARLAQESLQKYRELNYSIGENMSMDTLQRTAWSQGDLDESVRIGQERLEPYLENNADPTNFFQRENAISAYIYLGRAMVAEGDFSQTEILLKKTVEPFISEGHMNWWRLKIELLLAWIALLTHLGYHFRAARLIGAADFMYQQTKISYSPRERQEHQENLDACRAALGEDIFAAAFAEGQAITLEQAMAWVAGEV
jgi:tetratricopeptide (TPR) repeat protein